MSKSYKNKRNNDIKVSIYIIERNESKNDSKRMILKQIGSFIVNLVTVAASLATCFTLWEMRKERNQSYKPYFVIESVEYTDEYTSSSYDIRDIRNLCSSLDVDIDKIPKMYIIINNLGAGTATNIDIAFSDELYKSYWEIACRYYSDDKIQITDNDINYSLQNNDSGVKTSHSMNKRDLNVYKSYAVSGATIEIPLPEEYHRVFHSIAYCTNGDCEKLPAIELSISYDDLQGIHYKETYKISIDITVDLNSSETNDYAKYIIEQCK